MTLTEFLLARIAEDEAVACAADDAGGPGPWRSPWPLDWECDDQGDAYVTATPARVLADCAAKRQVVELHSGSEYGRAGMHLCQDSMTAPEDCETMRALVTAYADHPDCREEWRPMTCWCETPCGEDPCPTREHFLDIEDSELP